MKPAISVRGVSKRFRLGTGGHRSYRTLRESLAAGARAVGRWATRPFRRPAPAAAADEVWAVKDVSFDIRPGEVVGVVGRNGAGKSTLLKLMSRITAPTAGEIQIRGRVGSLLEVGTGFHPELTGRENVYLNGSILGMSRKEIDRKFDEIVAFSEVEKFLETPVKRYSSGMSVRLAFAVASHLDPEILLVDEVLAVGDAAFQRKSLGKMDDVAKEGRTVIFVSHNLALIQALCQRGLLLENGRVVVDAPAGEAIDRYLRGLEQAASVDLLERTDRDTRGWDESLVRAIEIRNADGGESHAVVAGRPVRIIVHVTAVLPMMECRLTIANSLGQPITTLDSEMSAPADVRDSDLGACVECDIDPLPLMPGRYRIDVLLKGKRQIQDGLLGAAFFDVEPGVVAGRPMPVAGADGNVVLTHNWRLPA